MITIKRGDTRTCIKAILQGPDKLPINLTGAHVFFHAAMHGCPPKISRAVDIMNAVSGEVWVVWVPGETDIDGNYRCEFEVVFSDGKRETYPNNGYIDLQIIKDLGRGVI